MPDGWITGLIAHIRIPNCINLGLDEINGMLPPQLVLDTSLSHLLPVFSRIFMMVKDIAFTLSPYQFEYMTTRSLGSPMADLEIVLDFEKPLEITFLRPLILAAPLFEMIIDHDFALEDALDRLDQLDGRMETLTLDGVSAQVALTVLRWLGSPSLRDQGQPQFAAPRLQHIKILGTKLGAQSLMRMVISRYGPEGSDQQRTVEKLRTLRVYRPALTVEDIAIMAAVLGDGVLQWHTP